jgi:hypothetical protein
VTGSSQRDLALLDQHGQGRGGEGLGVGGHAEQGGVGDPVGPAHAAHAIALGQGDLAVLDHADPQARLVGEGGHDLLGELVDRRAGLAGLPGEGRSRQRRGPDGGEGRQQGGAAGRGDHGSVLESGGALKPSPGDEARSLFCARSDLPSLTLVCASSMLKVAEEGRLIWRHDNLLD